MPILQKIRWFLPLLGLTFSCQSPEEPTALPEKPLFEWTDPSFRVAYPGPYSEVDSSSYHLASQALACLADGRPEGIPFPLSDSVKISFCDWPITVVNAQEFQSFFKAWHGKHAEVRYEAFNVRAIFNEAYQTTVYFCFGRWQFHAVDGEVVDRYTTVLFSTDSTGSLTAVTEWAMCWPENSTLVFTPDPDPTHFHYYCHPKLGSMEAAVRAVSTTQALFSLDREQMMQYLADTVQFTPSCGLNTRWSKEDLASSTQANDPFVGVDPISVIPFYQECQENHVILVFDYESFIEDGRLKRYSYLRTYILNRDLQIINILVQRRLVPNAINWHWQDARRG